MLASSTLLTLADGRLPAGGHAHSAGLEEAVASGRVATSSDLARAEIRRPTIVPAVASRVSVNHWKATEPGGPLQIRTMAKRADACTTLIKVRTRNLERK